jgi:hypothetical protein
MFVLEGSQVTYFDVDDTLIMWGPIPEGYSGRLLKIDEGLGYTLTATPHEKHVEELKQHKLRGHRIVVWSLGGWKWALIAVRALGIEKYVDVVMEKPTWIYDDLQPEQFMPRRKYLSNDPGEDDED